jgi:hypothetical protein
MDLTTADRDRRHFEVIPANELVHKRDRIPEHAFSEADRRLA